MDVLWTSTETLKPSQVKAKIVGTPAYTTVMTVLKRMSDKKLLSRKLMGNVYVYAPLIDKKTYACNCLDHLFEHLISTYGQEAITSFDKIRQQFKF